MYILEGMHNENKSLTKKFKLYLDTIIINLPTKAQKYKSSIYFDDETIKDIEHEGYTIIFYTDKESSTYLILSILKK
ncbi:hypothetical protein [Sulfurimonas aquatica]|nr:hypothetical protein [Sulfurimonas aquatica]